MFASVRMRLMDCVVHRLKRVGLRFNIGILMGPRDLPCHLLFC